MKENLPRAGVCRARLRPLTLPLSSCPPPCSCASQVVARFCWMLMQTHKGLADQPGDVSVPFKHASLNNVFKREGGRKRKRTCLHNSFRSLYIKLYGITTIHFPRNYSQLQSLCTFESVLKWPSLDPLVLYWSDEVFEELEVLLQMSVLMFDFPDCGWVLYIDRCLIETKMLLVQYKRFNITVYSC